MSARARSGGARFLAHGVPFVGLVLVGAFGLSRLVGGRLEVRDAARMVDVERLPAREQRRRARATMVEEERRRLIEAREAAETYEMKPVWRPGGGVGGH